MTALARHAAVFLDRDGTLIREVGYLRRVDQLEILPGVPEGLALLRESGFKIVIITNQSAVARGWLAEDDLGRIHDALKSRLAQKGVHLDGIYYCPHHPTEGIGAYRLECSCRKPKGGMIERAREDLDLDPTESYVVGDQQIDMEMARRVGATAVRIGAGNEESDNAGRPAPAVAGDFLAVARWIIGHASQKLNGRVNLRR